MGTSKNGNVLIIGAVPVGLAAALEYQAKIKRLIFNNMFDGTNRLMMFHRIC